MNVQATEAFDFQTKDSASEVQDAIMHRETVGGIVVDPTTQTTTIYTASGNGAPYATLLNTIAQGMQAQGQQVMVEELAPLSENDPQGTSLSTLGLPLAFGGMISAATLTLLLKNKPWHKLAGSLIISLVGGLVAAALMQYGYDLFPADTNFWSVAGTISLGIAAISLFVIGLAGLIGMAGVGIGAILTIFIANPLSGLATGWWWLPQPWGAIGQFLPIGATGHLLRSDLFFNGTGATQELWTLIAWALIGVALSVISGFRPQTQNVAS
ncbi:integral membrane protein [Corynebacterium suranareeae]|uniref:Integral membrane protein n=1 Tax=Corynebacterium suranareeae TaxID=2506452 RepID=A0A161JP58_9CORY|nr:ABC transporter ATP-binding protein [Corynebacterium suranareeae]BAU97068.1 integral membrane protein [Corynebacterium suranareeae]